MSKDKQLTPVMQAIKKVKDKFELPCYQPNQTAYFSGLTEALRILESILPAEKKAMIEFGADLWRKGSKRLNSEFGKISAEEEFERTFKTEEG